MSIYVRVCENLNQCSYFLTQAHALLYGVWSLTMGNAIQQEKLAML